MQAAGGAPVGDSSAAPGDGGGRRGGRLRQLLLVAGVVLVVDLVTKLIAVHELSGREPISLLGGLLTLRLVRNPGAAFGMVQGFTVVLTLIAVSVAVVIVRMARRLGSTGWAVALGLILGGATGNLVDRFFREPGPGRGHVVDFLELPRWPVFNVADMAIVSAGVLMVVLSARGVALEGPAAHPSPDDESPENSESR